MEAYCNPDIDYSRLTETIKEQKEKLKEIISMKLLAKKIHPYAEIEKIAIKIKNEVKFEYLN